MDKENEVYPNGHLVKLPLILQNGMSVFKTPEEQYAFLYSFIAAFSGLFTNVTGIYRQDRVHCNLYIFIVGPSGSGKGVLKFIKQILSIINDETIQQSRIRLAEYRLDKKNVNEKPPFSTILIPGNCTAAKLMEHLMANNPDVPTILIEEEADTVATANKSDYGGFTDIVRKGFHNEDVSLTRKSNDEFFYVRNPQLVIILGGTEDQIPRLIPNVNDGTIARLLFFKTDGNIEWSPVHPCDSCIDLPAFFKELSPAIENIYNFFKNKDVEVKLTSSQWQTLNTYGSEKLELHCADSDIKQSMVKRHALMIFKMAMTLTAIRMAEAQNFQPVIYCSNNDFEVSLSLIDASLEAAIETLEVYSLIGTKRRLLTPNNFFKKLPPEFTKRDALEIATLSKIAARTVGRWLETFIAENRLEKASHGHYIKR